MVLLKRRTPGKSLWVHDILEKHVANGRPTLRIFIVYHTTQLLLVATDSSRQALEIDLPRPALLGGNRQESFIFRCIADLEADHELNRIEFVTVFPSI
jgi:hypothetical protein